MKFLVCSYFATWLFIPWILSAGKRPLSTLAWIWAIMLFPFFGPIAYLLFGVDRITRAHRKAWDILPTDEADPKVAAQPDERGLFRALAKLTGFELATADEIKILPDAVTFYPALEDAILSAKHHIHIIFFIWEEDEYGRMFRDLLLAASKRGVVIRLLLDRIGSQNTDEKFFAALQGAGGKVNWFRTLNPLRRHFSLHLRNHRKLQIIDGAIAFVGGMNIGRANAGKNPDLGHWRDVQMSLTGNIVRSLQKVFAQDWYFASEEKLTNEHYARKGSGGNVPAQVLLGGPDFECDCMAESYLALLNHATHRAWIATGYFSPDERTLAALRGAALRGVDVRVIATLTSDHPYLAAIGQSYYKTLLAAGVRIFEYSNGINHAKTLLLDDDLALVGSANCDDRSMRLNFELAVLVRDRESTESLQATFEDDFAASVEVTASTFSKRPWTRRALEAIVRPLAPMV